MIWGLFCSIMKSVSQPPTLLYTRAVPEAHVRPSAWQLKLGPNWAVVMGSDLKHTKKSTSKCLEIQETKVLE